MCLSIDIKGWGDGKGTHVSVGVHMKGEFDSHLKGEITVRLVNQKERGRDHERKAVELSDITRDGYIKCILYRCKEDDRSKAGWGNAQFISHDNLYKPEEGKEYLKNDTLKFRVTNIVVNSV